MNENWKHNYVKLSEIKMHYVVAGSGELVILLHGFPEFWYSWRHQIPPLSQHFRVVAPDMRGYNETDKPMGVSRYSNDLLVQDIKDLIDALGEKKAAVVGHDWGGAVAWTLAMTAPEYVKKLALLNCPHPLSLIEAFLSMKFQQLQKSWYIFFFQTPKIPEEVLSRNNYELMKKMVFGSTVNKGTFTQEDQEKYVGAWSRTGALTGGINYYRANMNIAQLMSIPKEQQEKILKKYSKVKCPTLMVWGEEDVALDKSLTLNTEK
jgi:pimeloyl-ACP methyl ester carboxylesterase